jgi:hypothetical protein
MNNPFADARLGTDTGLIQTSDNSEIRQALIHMLQPARDVVRISSALLNPGIFDDEELRAALSQLARHSRYTEVRILVSNCKLIAERGHRLLNLSRRLSSSVPMRKLELSEHELQPEYVLVDDCGVIDLAVSEQDPASIFFCNRARNKSLTDDFDNLWHKSRVPVELRTLIV